MDYNRYSHYVYVKIYKFYRFLNSLLFEYSKQREWPTVCKKIILIFSDISSMFIFFTVLKYGWLKVSVYLVTLTDFSS